MNKTIRFVLQKGGRGSGHHGHRGRKGEVGGSTPGTGGSSSTPSDVSWDKKRSLYGPTHVPRGMSEHRLLDDVANQIGAKEKCVVMGTGKRYKLKDAKVEFPDPKFYTVSVMRSNGERKIVRLMGHMDRVPKPRERVAIAFDSGGRYKIYESEVIPDDGGYYSLWFYD